MEPSPLWQRHPLTVPDARSPPWEKSSISGKRRRKRRKSILGLSELLEEPEMPATPSVLVSTVSEGQL